MLGRAVLGSGLRSSDSESCHCPFCFSEPGWRVRSLALLEQPALPRCQGREKSSVRTPVHPCPGRCGSVVESRAPWAVLPPDESPSALGSPPISHVGGVSTRVPLCPSAEVLSCACLMLGGGLSTATGWTVVGAPCILRCCCTPMEGRAALGSDRRGSVQWVWALGVAASACAPVGQVHVAAGPWARLASDGHSLWPLCKWQQRVRSNTPDPADRRPGHTTQLSPWQRHIAMTMPGWSCSCSLAAKEHAHTCAPTYIHTCAYTRVHTYTHEHFGLVGGEFFCRCHLHFQAANAGLPWGGGCERPGLSLGLGEGPAAC